MVQGRNRHQACKTFEAECGCLQWQAIDPSTWIEVQIEQKNIEVPIQLDDVECGRHTLFSLEYLHNANNISKASFSSVNDEVACRYQPATYRAENLDRYPMQRVRRQISG